uniref:Uncharacterized protein n=1 Tax=Panagrolaimus davidi TaxID=227884 RepID=A0A914P8L3_9BILA
MDRFSIFARIWKKQRYKNNFFSEGNDETFRKIYDLQKASIDVMIQNNTVQNTTVYDDIFLEVEVAYDDSMLIDGAHFDKADRAAFLEYMSGFSKSTLDPIYNSDRKNFTKLLNDLNLFLILSAPTVYEVIRFKNISDLGPLENLFSFVVEYDFEDVLSLIFAKNGNVSCAAYEQLNVLATGTAAEEDIKKAFDKSLCAQSRDTLAKWHQVLDNLDPEKKKGLFGKNFDIGLSVFEFAKIAKAFRPTVYDEKYFGDNSTYSVINALNDAINSGSYTDEEKAALQDLVDYAQQNFPSKTPDEREVLIATKFTEIVSENSKLLKTFGNIPLAENDGTFYDLILWIIQKGGLEDTYKAAVDYETTTTLQPVPVTNATVAPAKKSTPKS